MSKKKHPFSGPYSVNIDVWMWSVHAFYSPGIVYAPLSFLTQSCTNGFGAVVRVSIKQSNGNRDSLEIESSRSRCSHQVCPRSPGFPKLAPFDYLHHVSPFAARCTLFAISTGGPLVCATLITAPTSAPISLSLLQIRKSLPLIFRHRLISDQNNRTTDFEVYGGIGERTFRDEKQFNVHWRTLVSGLLGIRFIKWTEVSAGNTLI
jgi:hypothetical protein